MRGVFACSLFAFVALAGSSHARIWYVEPDSTGQVMNIQAGIDSCATGDTVVAMPGVYSGDGNWDIDFKGKPIVVMAGSSFDPAVSDSTIIDCEQTHRAFYFHSNEDSSSVLAGFVIQRGCDDYPASAGGGIYCASSSPTIENNEIRFCYAIGGGSGILCVDSSPRIVGNRVHDCASPSCGAGISCEGGSPYIADNEIYHNDCTYCAGTGLCCRNCTSLRIIGNTIHCNWGASDRTRTIAAPDAGSDRGVLRAPLFTGQGGVSIDGSDGVIEGNTIAHNGGELAICRSTLSITDNLISGGGSYAAVTCRQSAVTIAHNRISSLDPASNPRCDGLAISLRESLPSRIVDNDIGPGDTDWRGLGAIWYDGDSTTVIENNSIHDNWGSGIKCYSSIRIAHNVIYANDAWDSYGGGIYCEASPVIEGNTIVGNTARYGAGIYCAPGSSPLIRNNIIANGVRTYGGYGGEGIYSDTPTITTGCNDVYNNAGGNYVGIPDQTSLNGNISEDPVFCDATHYDYTIHQESPCAPCALPGERPCGLIGALGIGCYYIATMLQGFHAEVEASAVVLTWQIASTREDVRFSVLRREDPTEEYREIAGAEIVGSSSTFSFRDTRVSPGTIYRYRVDVSNEHGRSTLFETDPIAMPALPLSLGQNFPNPFNPSTRIEYYLPRAARVNIEIYDASGKRIARLAGAEQLRGFHSIEWRGIDDQGNEAASGVYFYRLRAGAETISKKMLLLR